MFPGPRFPCEILAFIQDPEKAIRSGDARANELNDRYKSMMPAAGYLTDEQTTNTLAHLNQQTEALDLKSFSVPKNRKFKMGDSVVAPVKNAGLFIELEDYIKFPVQKGHASDKGIATLRADPAGRGSLFVSDQMGLVYRVSHQQPRVYLDIRGYFPNFIFVPGIGTGLGSFIVHPDFMRNKLLYTTHAEKLSGVPAINEDAFPSTIEPPLQWMLTEWKIDDPCADKFTGSRREVLRVSTPTTAHGFQDIGFAPVAKEDPDYGMLYIGCGDGGSNNLKMPELCHNPRSLPGTLLHIDPLGTNGPNGHYGIPAANPFAGNPDPAVRREIWAYGFRNPHRMCWDTSSGLRMIVADIGESNVEEVNIVEKGGDYGWSRVEGMFGIDTKTDLKVVFTVPPASLATYHEPFGQIDHKEMKAISGGFVYRGSITKLRNKYVFGDIVSGKLFYMNLDATLSDTSVYAITIIREGKVTSVQELSHLTRAHLRIGYDEQSGDLFIMTKADGMVRRVAKAGFKP